MKFGKSNPAAGQRTRVDIDPELLEAVKQAALRDKMPVADFMRSALLARVHRNDEAEEIAHAQLMNLAENMDNINRKSTAHAENMRAALGYLKGLGDTIPKAVVSTIETGLAGIAKTIEETSGIAVVTAEITAQSKKLREQQDLHHRQATEAQRSISFQVRQEFARFGRVLQQQSRDRIDYWFSVFLALIAGVMLVPLLGFVAPGSGFGRAMAERAIGAPSGESAVWMMAAYYLDEPVTMRGTSLMLGKSHNPFRTQYKGCVNKAWTSSKPVACSLTMPSIRGQR